MLIIIINMLQQNKQSFLSNIFLLHPGKMFTNTIIQVNFLAICLCICLIVKNNEVRAGSINSEITAHRSCVFAAPNFPQDLTTDEYDRKEICSPLTCPEVNHRGKPSSTILQHRLQRYLNTIQLLCNNFYELNRMQIKNLMKLRSAVDLLCNRQAPSTNLFGFNCPATAEIEPCTCDTTTSTTLDCTNVGSFTKVKNILNTAYFPNTKFEKFIYKPPTPNINERIFPNNTFGPLSFENVVISSSGVKEIELDAFNGSQTTLIRISLDLSQNLQIFPFASLTDYANLQIVDIVDGDINEIPNLGTIPNLKIFNVINSKVNTVQSEAFTNIHGINLIDLSLNSLESVGIVSSGWYLSSGSVSVYLDSNELSSISNFACHQPIILDASSNSLTTFSEAVYKPLLDIGARINVQINNISCTEFEWVTSTQQNQIISDC